MLTNQEGQPLYLFDRSRLETDGHCHRDYFWSYSFLGIGLKRLRALPEWSLLTGTYAHEGIELVLKGTQPQIAAMQAATAYDDTIRPQLAQLQLEPDRLELLSRELEQELDLVQALVYGWSLIGLPRYKAEYELIEIEKEEEIGFLVNGSELRMLTRTDMLSRHRAGHLMIHNLKTVSSPNQRWQRQWSMDQQTLTERIATEHRVGAEVLGVVIEGLCKGKRDEYPKGSGFYQHNSPLVWAWASKLDGQQLPGEQQEFYSRYEWTCTGEHKLGNGKRCLGGKAHRLSGVTKQRVQANYPGGIFAWIDYLAQNDRELLEQQFISLPPIGRSPYEVERWKRQVLPAELARQQNAAKVNELFMANNKQGAYELLDYTFPMVTGHGNCMPYNRECPWIDLCWAAADPFDESQFGPREPNHPAETEALVRIANAV